MLTVCGTGHAVCTGEWIDTVQEYAFNEYARACGDGELPDHVAIRASVNRRLFFEIQWNAEHSDLADRVREAFCNYRSCAAPPHETRPSMRRECTSTGELAAERLVVVNLFAGSESISVLIGRTGRPVLYVPIEIARIPGADRDRTVYVDVRSLDAQRVRQEILRAAGSRVLDDVAWEKFAKWSTILVWAGVPCEATSRLNTSHRSEEGIANAVGLFEHTIKLARELNGSGTMLVVENPVGSELWDRVRTDRETTGLDLKSHTVNYCQYHGMVPKLTRLLMTKDLADAFEPWRRVCNKTECLVCRPVWDSVTNGLEHAITVTDLPTCHERAKVPAVLAFRVFVAAWEVINRTGRIDRSMRRR